VETPTVIDAHSGAIWALAVVEHDDGQPMILTAGFDGALRSGRLDGSAGPLDQPAHHSDPIGALEAVEHDGRTLILTAGSAGTIIVRSAFSPT